MRYADYKVRHNFFKIDRLLVISNVFTDQTLFKMDDEILQNLIYWRSRKYTEWCHYNAVNFLRNLMNDTSTAHPLGWGMGVFCGFKLLIYILPQLLHRCMQYHVILNSVITALDCISRQLCDTILMNQYILYIAASGQCLGPGGEPGHLRRCQSQIHAHGLWL